MTTGDDLLQRFLDQPGDLDAQELEALTALVRDDPARAAELHRGLLMGELLSATLAQDRHGFVQRVVAARTLPNTRSFARRVVERSRQVRRPSWFHRAGWALAAALVVGVVLLAVGNGGGEARRDGQARRDGDDPVSEVPVPPRLVVGRIVASEGGGLERSGQVLPLEVDLPLVAGDRVRAGTGVTIQVGGSRVVLDPEADLVVEGTHRLRLGDGRALVSVDRTATTDAAGLRLLLVTPTTEIRVTGTVFAVVATPTWTRVRLDEGVLHLANSKGRIDLAPGEEAVSGVTQTPRRRAGDDHRLSFALARTDAETFLPGFERLADGAVITLATLPEDIVLRVIPDVDGVRSVRFRVDGGDERIEEGMPWNLVPDRRSHPALSGAWRPAPGMHLVEVAAFPRHGAQGRPLATASIVLHVR